MINIPLIQTGMRRVGLGRWAELLPHAYAEELHQAHGKIGEWSELLRHLPRVPPVDVRFATAAVSVGNKDTLSDERRQRLADQLMQLQPWRKGPFSIHGLQIDAEWQANLKWSRVARHMMPLKGRLVLDVGAGNGYYGWRMLGAGARMVVGIDPTWGYLAQFLAVRHFLGDHHPHHLLPFRSESLPTDLQAFDTVFSMGVLYHRRSPLDHLLELRSALKPGGELVLETLVIQGESGATLLPADRYAKMRNIWFIPSVPTLEVWLERCGFESVRTLDVTPTTTAEQRATAWMTFESLADFLDPADPSRTIEGYPAPQRAIVLARCPLS